MFREVIDSGSTVIKIATQDVKDARPLPLLAICVDWIQQSLGKTEFSDIHLKFGTQEDKIAQIFG